MKAFIGIDTSCYTTSVALMREDGTLVADIRQPLTVKAGGRGLAQSEMVYQHTRNLPVVFAASKVAAADQVQLAAVAVSNKPRPAEDSFMPAFLVGEGYAKVLALSHDVPCYFLSHQENHILAGIWSAGGPSAGRFLVAHVSGGTTEITAVEKRLGNLSVTLLGGSQDIAAGQLVDRIGVAMGLSFPAGPKLELLAKQGHCAAAKIPVAVRGLETSFSGPETQARKLLDQGVEPQAVAAGVEVCIAESLGRLIRNAAKETGITDILFVGGVVANTYIRGRLATLLADGEHKLFFPLSEFSSDNAVGAAYRAMCLHSMKSACI